MDSEDDFQPATKNSKISDDIPQRTSAMHHCPKCTTICGRRSSLLRHLRTFHGDHLQRRASISNVLCSICGAKFSTIGCLRRHVHCTHKDAAVEDVCPLKRKSNNSESYESSSTFQCPCCSKAFSNGTNLRRHAKNCHSGDPLKKCQVLISQKRGRGASINLPPSDTEPEHLIETQSRELVLLGLHITNFCKSVINF